jgi:hypothetical protein
MPKDIAPHASHIFNTVQLPQHISTQKHVVRSRKVMKQRRATTTAPQDVSISFLNSMYSITSNQGSSNLSQSVFETSQAYFSPDDLTLFQKNYGLPVQAAEIVGGYTTASCSLVPGSGEDCFEANLDTQYIMGIAQSTNTKGDVPEQNHILQNFTFNDNFPHSLAYKRHHSRSISILDTCGFIQFKSAICELHILGLR